MPSTREAREGQFEFSFAPADRPEANTGASVPALIEGVIPMPAALSFRSKALLERLYTREHISAREISRLAGVSRSGALKALDRFSIPRNEGRAARNGQVPFGFDYLNHQLVTNEDEQAAIRMRSAAASSRPKSIRSVTRQGMPTGA